MWLTLSAGVVAAACGDSGSNPSGTTTNVAITLPSVLKVGETSQATAVATLSGGNSRTLSAGWQSDTPRVATVTTNGLVAGVANGLANIFIISDGMQATRNVRVVPDYQGQWAGTYRVNASTPFPSSSYQHMCADYSPGAIFSLSMTLTQNGQSITGQFIASGLPPSSFVALTNGDGGLDVRGATAATPFAYDFTWRLTGPTAPFGTQRVAGGTVSLARTGNAGLVGGCNIEGTIVSLFA